MLNRSLYIMSSKLLGYGVRLILPYFLVRLMTVADFGAYRQFFLLEVYIATLFQLGLNQALYYFIPRDERNSGAYFLNSVLMNVTIFTAAFVVIGLFVGPLSQWLNMAILKDAFWLLAAYTVFLMLTTACDCYLTARQKIKSSALFEIGGQVLASAVTVITAYLTRRLDAVLMALVVARAVQLIAMLGFIHFRLNGFFAERYFFGLREQIRYGVILGLAGTCGTMLTRLHDFFVSRYYGTEVYAVYSVGCTEIPVIQIFTQSIAVVALGQFASLELQHDREGIRRLWRKILTSTYAVTLPTIAFLLLVAKPLIVFMFTGTYADAVPIFQINTLLKLHLLFNATLVLRAMDRNGVSIWVNAATLLAAPFLLYAGMALGGLIGIIAAQAVLMVASRLAPMFVVNRITDLRLPYVVGVGELAGFYRDAWTKARHVVRSRLDAAAVSSGRGGR